MGSCCTKTTSLENLRKRAEINLYIKKSASGSLADHFILKEEVGTGNFSVVRRAVHRKHKGLVVAVKSIDKQEIVENYDLLAEIEILKTLDHPNLIKFFNYFDSKQYLHIVTEYCSGGTLAKKIADSPPDELTVAHYMKQILRAVKHLHEAGICHRDLKLDNFIFENNSPQAQLKLIDFGLSNRLSCKTEEMGLMVGTPSYMAPEVIQGHYSSNCDLWSCGVIMYVLLSGRLPFVGKDNDEVYRSILKGKVRLSSEDYREVSPIAKRLLLALLDPNPTSRLTADSALKHPWIRQACSNRDSVDRDILGSMVLYRSSTRMKSVAMNVIVKHMDSAQLEKLRTAFQTLDTSNTGYLSREDIEEALRDYGMSPKQFRKVFSEMDADHSGKVNYSEFLAATLPAKMNIDNGLIEWAFQLFDADGSGSISRANLEDMLENLGLTSNPTLVDEIMREANAKDQGVISLDEFKSIMNKV